QAAVPVLASDTADTLATRVLAQEHQVYPQAARGILEGRCRLEAGRVVWTSDTTPAEVVLRVPAGK
ncbi:MAG: phosphoribosylglycinamide formyltransferase, partial [Rhodocyclaceae bacterium]|nr:phosphoribosylglycinamide formyltransferase [Rhodocyclaceae bacterium]